MKCSENRRQNKQRMEAKGGKAGPVGRGQGGGGEEEIAHGVGRGGLLGVPGLRRVSRGPGHGVGTGWDDLGRDLGGDGGWGRRR